MRILDFEQDGRMFELCYHALLFSPLPMQRNELRCHGALLTKLEAIGEIRIPRDATGLPREFAPDELRFYVSPAGGRVVLEDAEWEFLRRHLDATVPTVNKALSRELEHTIEWLAAILPCSEFRGILANTAESLP